MNLNYKVSKIILNEFSRFYIEETCNVIDKKNMHNIFKYYKMNLEFFRNNKMLLSLANISKKCNYNMDSILNNRIKRYFIYWKELKNISRLIIDSKVEAAFFKTVSRVYKDISDLDLLVKDDKAYYETKKILMSLNYRPRKISKEQHLWSKKIGNTIVDVELHTSISVSSLTYYPKEIALGNRIIFDDIITVSPEDDILIISLHDIIKDLYIPLSNLLEIKVIMEKENIDIKKVIMKAEKFSTSTPILAYILLLKSIDRSLDIYRNNFNFLNLIFPRRTNVEFPYRPSFLIFILSYFKLIENRVNIVTPRELYKEIFSLAQTKGIDGFVRYVFKASPVIKSLNE